jgi:DNA polymerase-1
MVKSIVKKDSKRNTLVLLDAHAILHRAYHALPEFASSKGEPTGALYGLIAMLFKIVTELKPDYIVAAYDLPGPTYRHEAYDAYKAQRKKTDDDLSFQITRSLDVFKAFNIPVYSLAGFEADDVLGTIVETLKDDKDTKIIIASGDMDTLQLVRDDEVLVYTLKKGINDTILYNKKKVVERFEFTPALLPDYKGLRGDPSDNIIGVKGIGEKTATTIIKTFGTIESMYKAIKKDPEKLKVVGLTDRIINLLKENEEEAVFSKMLATIRRDAPIDFVLPDKNWRDGFNEGAAQALFAELEFKTLGARLKTILDNKVSQKGNPESKSEETLPISIMENIEPVDLAETALALSVLDSNIMNPSLTDILQFAKAESFAKAKEFIFTELKKRNLSFVYENIEKPLIPIIKKMETRGVKIHSRYLKTLSKDYHKKLSALESKIWESAGLEFNINSPKQLGDVIFEKMQLGGKNQKKTSTGMKSTKESELEKMKETHPIISQILEYRELQKLLSTYIDSIPPLLDSKDRLHTNMRQMGSTTGRMSSTNPNLQNIPIKTELGRSIRNAFVVDPEFDLVSIDYSQIELRVAAILSNDHKLLEIFKGGEDVHEQVAVYMFKVSKDKVTKEMRRAAKTINFGILYGMGVNALKQNLGVSREEAQKFYNEYFSEFSELKDYLDKVKVDAEKRGYTETLFGRRRYFEGLKSKIPYIKAASERMAINAPVQGTAADIIKLAMIALDDFITTKKLEKDVFMTLQVHDELLFEIKKGKSKLIAKELQKIMESVLPKEKSKGVVPATNASLGPSWGDMQELAKQVPNKE